MALPPAPLEPDGSAGPPAPSEPRRPRLLAALGSAIRAGRDWLGRLARRAARFALVYGLLAAISVAGGLVVVAIAAEYGYQPNRDTTGNAAGRPMTASWQVRQIGSPLASPGRVTTAAVGAKA